MFEFYKKVLAKYFLITADFKTAEKKFLDQGEDKTEINKYLDLFKKLRDKNKLTAEEKNIDLWGKKSFKDFKKRLDELEKQKTNTEKKKGAIEVEKKIPGAEKIAENKDWVVYHITTNEASAKLGLGTEWCIKHKESNHWQQYSSKNNIYFIISKNRGKDDPWFKIALLVDVKGKKTYWDRLDKDHPSLPSDLSIPKFKTEKAKFFVTIEGKKYDLENLPEGLKVGGHLDLSGTPITSLPKGLKVGGNLDLRSTPIKSLPDDLDVNGNIYVDDPAKIKCSEKLKEKLRKK